MNRLAAVVFFSVAALALADVNLKMGGTSAGVVRDINCAADGGLTCTRATGTRGDIRCFGASATEPGCITPSDQTFSGNKDFTGAVRVVNAVHASLPTCDSGKVGRLAYCTTHGTLAQCKDLGGGVGDWQEIAGSNSSITLATVAGNRLLFPLAYLGTFTLPYSYTVKRVSAVVVPGTGAAATVTIRLTDASRNCDCAVHCDTATIDDCTGSCAYPADSQVAVAPVSDGCTTPVTLRSDVVISGYK